MKKTTEICGHNIRWHVETKSVKELTDFEQDRIADLIKDGYSEGELCMSYVGRNNQHYETRGWWEIVNWQDIALELYNVLKKDNVVFTPEANKAIGRFDRYWN